MKATPAVNQLTPETRFSLYKRLAQGKRKRRRNEEDEEKEKKRKIDTMMGKTCKKKEKRRKIEKRINEDRQADRHTDRQKVEE